MIQVTGSLKDIFGVGYTGGSVLFRLCGYGTAVPTVTGSGVIANTAPIAVSASTGSFSVNLYPNNNIAPASTFYSVQFLDGFGNVLQTGSYQFTGSGPVDISAATPYNPSAASPLNGLVTPFTYSGNANLPNTAHPVIAYATGGSYGINLTLPVASLSLMAPITVKKADGGSGDVNVICQGSDTIDGDDAYQLASQYQFVTVIASQSGWNIIGKN